MFRETKDHSTVPNSAMTSLSLGFCDWHAVVSSWLPRLAGIPYRVRSPYKPITISSFISRGSSEEDQMLVISQLWSDYTVFPQTINVLPNFSREIPPSDSKWCFIHLNSGYWSDSKVSAPSCLGELLLVGLSWCPNSSLVEQKVMTCKSV